MLYLYPYKTTSQSARSLREGLSSFLNYKVKMVLPDGRFKPKRSDVVLNWGNSTTPTWDWTPRVDINNPDAILKASNKLVSFQEFTKENLKTPDWTTDQNEAQDWVNNGYTVVVRHVLTGHSGKGIEIIQEGQVPAAPLYVKYKKKRFEYRVHVFKGEVIDTQQKKKRNEAERPDTFNTLIRNSANGWVYCRNDIAPDIFRNALAVLAVKTLGLDFGAVDIIYNEHENQNYLLEVNTAPGLEGSTLETYMKAILK